MQSTIVTKAEKAHRYAQELDRLRDHARSRRRSRRAVGTT